MIPTVFWIELCVILAALFYGARKGGMALGLVSGIGLLILVFVFHVKPGTPPVSVILTILAVIMGSATLQASGGLDCLLQVAEKALRSHPRLVVYIAPYCAWILTILCGTGHTVYTLLPIIYDVAIKTGIRPERPMAASTIAAQMGIICSPASVALVSAVAILDGHVLPDGSTVDMMKILSVTVPAGAIGVFAEATYSVFRGKDLDKDPEFQKLISDPEQKKYVYGDSVTLIGKKFAKSQWAALWIFLGCVAIVAIFGADKSLRPVFGGKAMSMTLIIQMMMLVAGALMVIFCNTRAADVGKSSVFRAGAIAIAAVYGVAWMSDTLFQAHLPALKASLTGAVQTYPWLYAVVLLVVSKFVNSQAAAVAIILPVALQVGVPTGIAVSMISACYGYYILPTYPSDLAALQFDRSGTCHIGKFVINHSFIIPGLIGVITATLVGTLIGWLYGWL
ncbi:anaerobic C4-dicarboxylate transporter [Mesosutterella sp. OilRF-GAM-744-9]|uniref:C4-dicarboxylate transporter n=1 Tax=Mesosutterella porci TaxID=2915351 RepID=A0ABS9MP12_9BURK|nr:anaerobic C4-dicarboxylate transporter [Mesosutterella sp. oilRF-744-WT-GAM-9]MCG5030354.1 anaerobic C4-dicarboxylate transporter [Mesosutterella sp. oilRF-744-WT-GAM-9]MCI6530652.1 anaerobic C4-dicarboxylate transporter [Mesosutterella sp.]